MRMAKEVDAHGKSLIQSKNKTRLMAEP